MNKDVSRNDTILGLAVVLLAIIVGWQTTLIPVNAIYAKVGPKVFPWLVTAMLAALGVALTVQGFRGGWSRQLENEPIDRLSLGWLLLALLLNVLLIKVAGFIIASTMLFVFTARAFGSHRYARDAGIGFALAFAAYFAFDRLLGYRIGSGIIERFL